MKYYDFKKAKQIIEERKESISIAQLGMAEDWFWTANTVFRDGSFIIDLDTVKEICGIFGSEWATPTLSIVYKDDLEENIEVSTGSHTLNSDEKAANEALWSSGPLSLINKKTINHDQP